MSLHALAFGAHPDDVELTCGGTLAKLVVAGYRTGMVTLTSGELSTRGTVETRRAEFKEAARVLGVETSLMMSLPDGGLSPDHEQKLEVIRVIRELQPQIVFAPYWEDRHPDHANASRLVSEAAFLAGLARIETGQPSFRPYRVLFYPSRYDFRPSFIVDVSATHHLKLEAVAAYRSQFPSSGETLEGPQTNISHPGFLATIVARDRWYGGCIGADYGEAFLVREPPAVDDPVAFFGSRYEKAFV
jgi:bacillithiol biosynthesis deacetylase BshB1